MHYSCRLSRILQKSLYSYKFLSRFQGSLQDPCKNRLELSMFFYPTKLMVDYACFLVKCINYKNVKCIQKICFLQDLARFLQVRKILQDSCDRAQFLARILQKCHCIQESCKNWIFCKNLQDFLNLQESCKILQEIIFLSTRVMLLT